MSEPEFDIDAAGAQFEQSKQERRAEEQQQLPLMEVEEEDEPHPDDVDGNKGPPGFKSYDDYLAAGGDPDMFRGKKAYVDEHHRIDENKRLRSDVRGLQTTVQQTMDAVSEWQTTEREKMRREIEGELHTAKENEDVDGAIDAQQRLDKLEAKPTTPAPRQEIPAIVQFRENNPILDVSTDDYDEDFNQSVEGFFNNLYGQLSQNGNRKVSDGQVKRCLNKAMVDARAFHGIEEHQEEPEDNNRGESPRNQRKRGAPRQRRSQQSSRQTTTPKAEDFKIENPRNGRDTSGAGVRDMIHEKAYKSARKGGKSEEDATKYANQETQRFEASLAQ